MCMLMVLKSKLLGLSVWHPWYIERLPERSFRPPHAGTGCGRIAASGDEYSMLDSGIRVYAGHCEGVKSNMCCGRRFRGGWVGRVSIEFGRDGQGRYGR